MVNIIDGERLKPRDGRRKRAGKKILKGIICSLGHGIVQLPLPTTGNKMVKSGKVICFCVFSIENAI